MADFTYKDFDLDFGVGEFGDINTFTDEAAIKQSIKTVVLTRIRESSIFQQPRFGSNVYNSLGEKINGITAIKIRNTIRTSIENWEKRVEILDISTKTDLNKNIYIVNIKYKIKNLNIDDSISIDLGIIK